MTTRLVATYSIVARDPANGDLGVAVQSRFLAVGSVVPWAIAGVGAVATQALAHPVYGPNGLRMIRNGATAQEALARLIEGDDGREDRQVGIVDAQGSAATFTGGSCFPWAGGRTGEGYAAQGNILVSAATVDALAGTFEATRGSLADRLLAALAAGQVAGGDSRGMESAALLVVRENGGYNGLNDRYIDLRVDDHPSPIEELRRIKDLHDLYMERTPEGTALRLDEALVREIQDLLIAAGDLHGPISGNYDAATERAMRAYTGRANLEMRTATAIHIDPRVLEYMRVHGR